MPQFNYYPYLLTGEPWHLDMLIEHANSAVYQRYTPLGQAAINVDEYSLGSGERSLQVSSDAPTYGDTVGGGEQRTDAWASALVAAAAAICPDQNPDCRSYKPYFGDMANSSWTAAVNIHRALPPYGAKHGLWHVPDGAWPYVDHWQMAYFGAALSLAVGATENPRALVALDDLVKWFDHVVSKFGGWHAGAYMTIVKSGASSDSPLVTGDDGVAFYGPTINWSAGGHFNFIPFANYVPANGDKFIFADTMSGLGQVTPAGFTKYRPYYLVNLNGTQFDLSHRPDGPPVQLTDNYSGTDGFFFVSTTPPPVGSISNVGSTTSYNTEVLGMLNYAKAVGAHVRPPTIADLAYRAQQAGVNFTIDPKWAMVGNVS